MRVTTRTAGIALVVVTLAIAGCGSDGDGGSSSGGGNGYGGGAASGGGGGGEQLALAADPDGALEFDKRELAAPAGTVTITLDNQSSVPHAVEVEGNGIEKETKTVTGGEAALTADLEPGRYEFYCPVGNHRQTMKGVLVVR